METVTYRHLRASESAEASRQLTASYCAAYRGLMSEEYLISGLRWGTGFTAKSRSR